MTEGNISISDWEDAKERIRKIRFMKVRILDTTENDLEEGFYFLNGILQVEDHIFLILCIAEIDSFSFYGGIHQKVFEYHRLLSDNFPFAIYYKIIEGIVTASAELDCRHIPTWIKKS